MSNKVFWRVVWSLFIAVVVITLYDTKRAAVKADYPNRFEWHGHATVCDGCVTKIYAVCDTGNGTLLYLYQDHMQIQPNGCYKKSVSQ